MKDNQFIEDFATVFDSLNDYDSDLAQAHIQKYREMEAFLPTSSSFFIITDTPKQVYPYVSKNFEVNLGLDIKRMNTEGLPYWASHFHPDEVGTWVKMLADLMEFTMKEIPLEDRYKVCYTWNFRVRTSKGNYVNIHEHLTPLVLDQNGKPIVGVAFNTIFGSGQYMPIVATCKKLNEAGEYETLLTRNYSHKMLSDRLSNRERDIMRLLALQNTSKEIGQKLFISPLTVDTHRRKIIKKLNLKSTADLIGYYGNGGIY